MDTNKVLKLAQESGIDRQLSMEVPFVVDRLQQFAALIEAEVRKKGSRDNVFELMLEAGCSKYCDPKNPELEGFIVNDSVLNRVVAIIEAEVRGDEEPVAWMYGWDGKKHLTFVDQRPIEKSYPHFNKSTPLYTHPAPAVVRQLVEALQEMFNIAIDSQGVAGYHQNGEIAEWDDFEEIDKTKAALAAAKEAGL